MRHHHPPRGARLGPIISVAVVVALTQSAPVAAQQNNLSIERISSAPYPSGMVASPAGGQVAWIFNERGARNIWISEAATGSGPKAWRVTAYVADDGLDITDLAWSADGGTLVFARGGDSGGRVAVNPGSRPEGPKVGSIWTVSAAGGEPRLLGEGYAPRPAPAGDMVAFLRAGQPMGVSLQGGEAKPLFQDRGQITSLQWSPDGKKLSFASSRVTHSFIGVFDTATRTVVWMAPSIDKDALSIWSPDGTRLAFIRTPSGEDRTQGLNREGTPWEIWTADSATGEGRRVWVAERGTGSRFRALFNSADSLFWTQNDLLVFPWEVTGWVRLYSVPVSGGKAKLLTPGESEVFAGALSADRGKVIYASNQGDIDRRHIWEVGVKGEPPRQLSRGPGIEDFPVVAPDGRLFAVHGGPRSPLVPVELANGRLTDLAPGALPRDFPGAQLIEPQLVTFKAADGVVVHGQLFLPNKLQGKAPALLFGHGGPTNRQTFAAWDSFETHAHLYEANQYLAANGYVVLSINYRGGAGYGLDFREAKGFGTNGASELNDIVGAAQYLQSRPEVDPKRLGVWGGSYGGRMASLAMARAPEYWVAGVDYAGVHDMGADYGVTSPQAAETARQSSAIAHVGTWRAPVKLMIADGDSLTPQTIALGAALRQQGVDVETMMIPDEVHFLLKHESWNRIFKATKEYLDRHLKP